MSSSILSVGNSIVSSATFLETKTGSTSGTGSVSFTLALGTESPTRKILIATMCEYYPSGVLTFASSLTVGGVSYPLLSNVIADRPEGTAITTQYSAYVGNIRLYVTDGYVPTGTTGTFTVSYGVSTNLGLASYNLNNLNGVIYNANNLTSVNATVTKKPNTIHFIGTNSSTISNSTVRIVRTAGGFTYAFGEDFVQSLEYANTVYVGAGTWMRPKAVS